jgi:signal transduction histidine kinase
MKIQTQARLLVAGIVLAPLLIVLTSIADRQITRERDAFGIPTYDDVSVLMNENMTVQDWESFTRFIARSRNLGEVTVFRDDFFVLYSTNPEYRPGVSADRESVLSLFNDDSRAAGQSVNYFFATRNLNENRVYILNKITPQFPEPGIPPFFLPIIIFIILMTIFAVCMSIVITRTITNSVRVLENATRRIAEGELDLNVDVKGSNEITSLTNSLNKMRNALKEEELRRSRFIMGITHDLKTPLALIKGYAEAIEDGVASHSDAAEIIIAKTDQLESMINDLINYVQLETGEWRELLLEVNMNTFLTNLAKTMGMDVELLHHKFISEINVPENLHIRLDEKLAGRALENLINNAIRHTPDGSIIRFEAVLLDNTVKLTVSDNGLGIDKDDLPHIFEMFYRGSPSRREQGMGLGLAVVKWVVDYHGWAISVSAEKEKGSVFTITIPIIQWYIH